LIIVEKETDMYYGYYPYGEWASPWGYPTVMGYPGMENWGYPYPGMWQMPYYTPWGGFGFPGMSPAGSPMPGGYGTPGMPPGGFGSPGMAPYGPPMAPEQEIEFLRDQAHMLKDQLDRIDARIKELEKESK
jgi:hypothetical protein